MIKGSYWDEKARNEVFEASHLASDGECLLDAQNPNSNGVQEDIPSPMCPSHFTVTWFSTKKHMPPENESALHRLARLSFNTIQVQHQKELKKILR